MSFFKNIFKKKEEETVIKTYQDFWNWFLLHEKNFHKVIKEGGSESITHNFFDKIGPKLDQLKEGIFYLSGMLDDNTADLILTADGNLKNFYLIEELVSESPNLPNWKIQAHKPSFGIENTAISMAGYEFRSENMFFYANEFDEYPDEIDITIVHEDFTEENKSDIINGCYIFLDNYLGEIKSMTAIDNISFKSKDKAEKELVPIEKLDAFLAWREKEFVEKYEGTRHNTDNDNYVSLQTTLKNENPLFIIINSDLLEWSSKASHPWILKLKITYNGENNNGLPEKETYQLLNEIEEDIVNELKDIDGYLNIGRETGDNLREVFFACKDYRKPCKVVDSVIKKYQNTIDMDYDVNKDKYWQCFESYRQAIQKNP